MIRNNMLYSEKGYLHLLAFNQVGQRRFPMSINRTSNRRPLAIESQGLTKKFGPHLAVDTLDLAIRPGTIFGFLGPNGAGKTTTIRMLLGLIRPTSGSGRILGYDIISERAHFLSQIGALVEAPAFYPSLSGSDNLRVLAHTSGNGDRNRIAEVMELVGLSEQARERVRTYSLGMKQRLAIAATLLNRPQIIFLDEPTNGLDPAGTVSIRELITSLGASGHTIFLSSHLLHEVEQICEEVAIISHGKLVSQGRVADLLTQDTTLLVEAEPLALVQEVVSRFGVIPQISDTRSVKIALAPEHAPELIRALVNAGAKVYQVAQQQTSLEHLFLELTNETHNNDGQPKMNMAATVGRQAS
jgi:ABC-type multidrug transport system ATPase subunit